MPGFNLDWIQPEQVKGLNLWQFPHQSGIPFFRVDKFSQEFQKRGNGEWTFFWFFSLTNPLDQQLALKFQQIGMKFEIYINGQLLDSQWPADNSIQRAVRHYLEPLPPEYLVEGKNTLVIRLGGDPVSTRTGLYFPSQSIIGPTDSLLGQKYSVMDNLGLLILLINLGATFALWISSSTTRFYRWLLMLSLSIAGFYFFRSPWAFDWITNTFWIKSLEILSLFLLVPLFGAYTDSLVNGKVRRVTWIYFLINLVLTILYVVFDRQVFLDAFYFVATVYWFFAVMVNFLIPRRFLLKEGGLDFIELFTTAPGISFMGLIVLLIFGLLDIFGFGQGQDVLLFSLGFLIFIFLAWVNILMGARRNQDDLIIANKHLESKVLEKTSKLSAAYREVESANFLKNRFMSILGHDLQGPMGAIIYLSQYLLEGFDELDRETTSGMLRDLFVTSQSLGFLMENLLSWSYGEEREFPFQAQQVDLAEMTRNTIELLKLSIEQKNLSLQANIPQELSGYGDSNMLSLIIRNILANAIKFTSQGKEIGVELSQQGDKIQILVWDQGVGMEPELVEALMAGQVARQLSTGEWKGTGLGMVLAVYFIKKHGGSMKVESKRGEGTLVSILLPISPERKDPLGLKSSEAENQ